MKLSYYAAGTLAAGLTIFIWGALAHTAIPMMPVHEFKDAAAMKEAVKANTSGDGVFMDPSGVFVVRATESGRPNASTEMGPYLVTELFTNCLQGLLLAWLVAWSCVGSVMSGAAFGFGVGLTSFAAADLSFKNWYGFSDEFLLQNFLDAPVGCLLAGIVLALIKARFSR